MSTSSLDLRRLPRLRRLCGLALPLLLAFTCTGCALLSKSEPITPRYFSPERAAPRQDAKPSTPASTASPTSMPAELRLGRITSTPYLDERMVYRDSPQEVGYYLERRWTEAPEHYLRRGLSRVLFEQRGVQQVVGGASATLDVELTAFEEIRGKSPLARAQAIVRLRDQRVVVWEETLTAEQPIATAADGTEGATAAVDALSTALAALIDRTADRTMTKLASLRVPMNGAETAQGPQGPPPPPPPRRAPTLQ